MSKTLIFIVVGVLAGAGVAAGVFMFVYPGRGPSEPTPEPTPVHVEGKLGPHITFASRVFNLRTDPGKAPVYLKLETLIEFETTSKDWAHVLHGCVAEGAASPCKTEEETLLKEFEEEIGSGRKLIEDAITTIVSAKSLAEVSTPDGKERMRAEIMRSVGELIPEPHVKRVLFTDFVTQ
ncbi:MAG: flagellar basal body-associated FliL family protein [Dehalococcoidia bacterium]